MKKAARKRAKGQGPSTVQLELPSLEEKRWLVRELVLSTGMEVLAAMLEQDREALCGPRYARVPREAHRFGYADGELALGGRRVQVRRPRVRSRDGREVALPTWRQLASEDPLRERAVEQMLVGVTTRKYRRSLEPLPAELVERGTSKSAVSRRFVAATAEQLRAWLKRDLTQVKLVALMVDALEIEEHSVLIALGIDEQGYKHILGAHEGATENATACKALLGELRERGLEMETPILVVIDGSKALRRAVKDVFGERTPVQRCQVHKVRNVIEHLPDRERGRVAGRMRKAYQCGDADRAKRLLKGLARQLESQHPGAASSLREGLDETLTVLRLGLKGALLRTLSSTNAIENLNGLLRVRLHNVKRWRGGKMVLRWVVAGLEDAKKGFRRVRGHRQIQVLLLALHHSLNGDVETIRKAG